MITVRPSSDRGTANFGWLDSRHTFSFGNYYDPRHMGFASLRVINEDKVTPGQGFSTHGHRDMEIISYVLEGELAHKDSIGNGSVIRPGDVQRMSAGTGILHSEYNASDTNPVHFLQIWVLPGENGIEPGYEQTYFAPEDKAGTLRLVGSRDGRDGSVTIHQDVNLYATRLNPEQSVTHTLDAGRVAWIHVARGTVNLDGHDLTAGDGAAVSETTTLTLTGTSDDTEVLLFDMAA
ncbi:pirin family protein [Oscillatoria sp. CS-180]|uniref:pirin family protein n=1 Tax=Oscillatoria sp. CS-180 TaxID=3021720 RepID=UPI00232AC11A|nr:pirin family protein [Oscillatoria sp. CS-180]MDB9527561.1 pirin family protein [Oscillatoria sp. CS-180]